MAKFYTDDQGKTRPITSRRAFNPFDRNNSGEDPIVNLPKIQTRPQRRLAYALTFSKGWRGKKYQFGEKGRAVGVEEARERLKREGDIKDGE